MARTDRYRYYREHHPDMPAHYALSWAKAEEEYERVLGQFGSWQFPGGSWGGSALGSFATADMEEGYEGPYTIRVGIGDDDQPVEWGDTEPTEEQRDNASAFYVYVQVLDEDGDELYHDGIGGVDVIDLPGYLQRTWEDAAAYALSEYLLDGALKFADNEARERSEWEARDTITNGGR